MKKQKEEEELRKMMQNKNVKEQIKMNQETNRSKLLSRLKDDVELMRKTKQVNFSWNYAVNLCRNLKHSQV